MNILVLGANGFIGKNLCLRLNESGFTDITSIHRNSSDDEIGEGLQNAEIIFHLAGVNRPKDESEFIEGNTIFTESIIQKLIELNKKTTIVFASSTQVMKQNAYGESKLKAEDIIKEYGTNSGAKHYIYRLPNVFGKWCKPNYNSFIATFCHNISREIPIEISNKNSKVNLVYIDDVCSSFISLIQSNKEKGYLRVSNEYETTVGQVAEQLYKFKNSRDLVLTEDVGTGLTRALYSTYLSYLEPDNFHYQLVGHKDERGLFCEFLKTKNSGQFSFFTAHPGIKRGSHYHHSKTEKFLVLEGNARFNFENIITKERYEIDTNSAELKVIESIPGWAHNIQNIGKNKLIVMLWANELFDKGSPDTISKEL